MHDAEGEATPVIEGRVPVLSEDDLNRLVNTCRGNLFEDANRAPKMGVNRTIFE